MDRICEIIEEIPEWGEMAEIYKGLGVKTSLEDIDVCEKVMDTLMEYSPLVRNRLTLMRLRAAIDRN